jgi:hypothetical protein
LQGPKPQFDFIACSGAKTEHIFHGGQGTTSEDGDGQPKEAQASLLKDTNPELVTLSIGKSSHDARLSQKLTTYAGMVGGNDVGFTDLLIRVSHSFSILAV